MEVSRSVLTKYQRDQVLSRREAHQFRGIADDLIGPTIDFLQSGGSQDKLRLLAALETEYLTFLDGGKITARSLRRHLEGRETSEFRAILSDLQLRR